jgi:site-specific recombinase XerD
MAGGNETALIVPPGGLVIATQASSDEELVQLWLGQFRSPNTRRGYRIDWRAFRAFMDTPLRVLTLRDMQTFAASLVHLADATQARRVAAIKSLIGFAHRLGYVPFDVGAPLQVPAIKDRLAERILTEDQMQQMLWAEKRPRNAALLRLLYGAGLRISEACGLCWRDLTPRDDTGQLNVFGKGGKTRVVLLPKSLWDRIQALRGDAGADEPVFRSRKRGGGLQPMQVHRIVKAAAKRAKLSPAISAHWFRHAHASHALDRGAPVHVVQSTLGHASLTTTTRYTHARPGDSSARYLTA